MKIKGKIINAAICISFLSVCAAFSHAAPAKQTPEASLKKLFPRLQYKSIKRTDIDGLYEVITGDRIVYFHPKTGYLFLGEIINKDGRNITREKMSEERYKLLSANDFKKAVKVGNGKNVVLEVTDPDCPFCRKMHAYWSMRKDVTRYVFFMPLVNIHPDSMKKAKYILASSDHEKAMFEAFCGSLDNKRDVLDKSYDDKGMINAQKTVIDKLQVSGTPSYWINGKFVSGANIPLIESFIGKADSTAPSVHDAEGSGCGEIKKSGQ
ncbi:MAG TPA: DsbC family protein [Geobacteraceae bacterium]|nr:DsbC family protein [Geobacteraceae bacterium]